MPETTDNHTETQHPIPNTQHPLLRGLNPVQQEAVQHDAGPLLIFAGAGSGKTRVLTHRVAYLISEKKVSPRHILAVTFTNKAAQEMKERIEKLVGENVGRHLWVGTFHATCARLLREHGEKIGIDRDFVVYDDGDQLTLIREVLRFLSIDEKKFAPRAVLSHISRAKEKLIAPEQWNAHFAGFFEDICGKVYPVYQERLRKNNALDFDDLLVEVVNLLQQRPEVLERLQERYRYIMVDEYQDVNHVQYVFLKLLADKYRNLCVVGDDDQCLPPGTLVRTPSGEKPIERLKVGDAVLATGGGTNTICATVNHVHKSHYNGPMYAVKAGDSVLRGTPHHLALARLEAQDKHYVYLMYRADRGFRIGITKSSRRGWTAGVSHDQHGFIVRSNQEHADKLWVLKVVETQIEARFWEELFSAKYGIPTMVFHSIGRNMPFDDALIKKLYDAIDTRAAAQKLMEDLDMRLDFPHYRPQNGDRRQTLNLVLYGGYRTSRVMQIGEHRIQWRSNNAEAAARLEAEGFPVRAAKLGGYRFETCRSDYKEALCLVKAAAEAGGLDVAHRAKINGVIYMYLPLSHLHPTMRVLVNKDGILEETEIESVTKEAYSGEVYDLEVDRAHTYLANDMLVHNSVYMFRGANVALILQFEEDYPEAKVLKLEQNYRSSQTILDAAYGVVRNNRGRKDKKLWTEKDHGTPLALRENENEQEEAVWIAQQIREEVLNGRKTWGDYAILYRTNAQSRIFEETFLTWQVVHRIVGGVRFYERREIKDILAYLRIINSPADSVSLRRVINVPTRGIGATTLSALEEEVNLSGRTYWDLLQNAGELSQIQARARVKLAEFASMIATLRAERDRLSVTELTQHILERSGYQAALEEEQTIEAQTRLENVKEMLNVTKEFEQQTEGPTLTAFLEQVSLVADIDSLDANADAVTLMTLHAAKGLEFNGVFLVGMEEGMFPHSRSMESDSEMEEERRLCYVGITRAKDELTLSYANRRSTFGSISYNPPSRFLKEIPKDLFRATKAKAGRGPAVSSFDPDENENAPRRPQPKLWTDAPKTPADVRREAEAPMYKPGDSVRHAIFGSGIVIIVTTLKDDTQVEVAFRGNVGTKKLLLSLAKLEKLK